MGGGCCVGNCGFCCVFETIKSWFRCSEGGCGYHPGPSQTELHAKKIADELQQMKNNMRERSEEMEREIINGLDFSMAEFLSMIKSINRKEFGGRKLDLNIEAIEKKNEELKKEVVGHIADYIDKHLVQTDSELSVILEEMDDEKRGRNFDNFVERLQRDALKSLKKKINDVVRRQEEMVKGEITARINEADKNIRDKQAAYQDILKSCKQERAEQEKNRMQYVYAYGLCDLVLDTAGEE